MERIVYQKTLDVHKNGVQFTLQGFETADKLSRTIEISLSASGDAIGLPLEQIEAMMYVVSPGTDEPSINKCTIKGNSVIYDVVPITTEGITEMQLKLIEARPEGAKSVLASPKFAIEVSKSNADDETVEQTPTFTALEEAVAKARAVYDARFLRMELSSDCMFRVYYADGTVYETDMLRELFHKGESILSQSYARGDTGVRTGEETDNAMYYSKVAKSASIESKNMKEDAQSILDEVRLHGVYTAFSVNFETGDVEYISPRYSFKINTTTGDLEAEGESYTLEDEIGLIVNDWLIKKNVDINSLLKISGSHEKDIKNLNDSIKTLESSVWTLSNNVYTKEEILEDETKAIVGLDEDATPNDVLKVVGEAALGADKKLKNLVGIWEFLYKTNAIYPDADRNGARIISPNGKYVFVHDKADKKLKLYRVENMQEIGSIDTPDVTAEYSYIDVDENFGGIYYSISTNNFIHPKYIFFEYSDTHISEVEVPTSSLNKQLSSYLTCLSQGAGNSNSFYFATETYVYDGGYTVAIHAMDKQTKNVTTIKQITVSPAYQQNQCVYKYYRDGEDLILIYKTSIVPHASTSVEYGRVINVERISADGTTQTLLTLNESEHDIKSFGSISGLGFDIKSSRLIVTGESNESGTSLTQAYNLDGELLCSGTVGFANDVVITDGFVCGSTSVNLNTLEETEKTYCYSLDNFEKTGPGFSQKEQCCAKAIVPDIYIDSANQNTGNIYICKKITMGGFCDE